MGLRFFSSFVLSSGIFVAALAAPSAARPAMVGEMYKVLKKNPYTLELGKDTSLKDAGKLCAAQRCYEIGVWVWETDRHRAQRFLIFEIDHKELSYLGGYRIDTKQSFAIEGSKIVFKIRKDWGNEIEFGPEGPPAQTWIDGENPTLFK